MDIAYNEYGDPFRLLFVRGVTGKSAAINGLMNQASVPPPAPLDHRQWRLCLALGGRCYSYYGHLQTDRTPCFPARHCGSGTAQLAPFYEMVSRVQPLLEGGVPVSNVGILFAERTRLRFPAYDRKPYVAPMEAITNAYIERSQPIEFINALDLNDPAKPLSRLRLLIVPLTAGLREGEIAGLRAYIRQGGNLLVLGDALRHDDQGNVLPDFAMARELGVSYVGTVTATGDLAVHGTRFSAERQRLAGIRRFVQVRSNAGETLLSVSHDGARWPLLQVQAQAKGKVAYMASLDSLELTQDVIDWLSGSPPVTVTGHAGTQVVLTHQPNVKRWILHLISDGDYTIDIRCDQIPARTVADRYPTDGWTYRIERGNDCLRIRVEGQAGDRYLVLE